MLAIDNFIGNSINIRDIMINKENAYINKGYEKNRIIYVEYVSEIIYISDNNIMLNINIHNFKNSFTISGKIEEDHIYNNIKEGDRFMFVLYNKSHSINLNNIFFLSPRYKYNLLYSINMKLLDNILLINVKNMVLSNSLNKSDKIVNKRANLKTIIYKTDINIINIKDIVKE